MTVVTAEEAKERMEELVELAAGGEDVYIRASRLSSPTLTPNEIPEEPVLPRIGGLWAGKFVLGPEFFEPMPDDWLDAFYNGPVFPDNKEVDVAGSDAGK